MTVPGSERALELFAVTKRFPGGARALDGVTLRLERGRMGALVGPNGSGKSTVLKLLAGLARPTSGAVTVLGRPAGDPAALARLGYMPDFPTFPSWLTAREFLRHMGGLSGMRDREVERAIPGRARWAGIEAIVDRPARDFSAGQRQRLGLVQALLHEPELLLLDEPASGLDPGGMAKLAALLSDLRREGRTIVLSSHFLPQVEALCDHAWLLKEGRLIWEGAPVGALSAKYLEFISSHEVMV